MVAATYILRSGADAMAVSASAYRDGGYLPEVVSSEQDLLESARHGAEEIAFGAQSFPALPTRRSYETIKDNESAADPIYFMDAVQPQHNPVVACGWIKRGQDT
jgi:hypothetical protein